MDDSSKHLTYGGSLESSSSSPIFQLPGISLHHHALSLSNFPRFQCLDPASQTFAYPLKELTFTSFSLPFSLDINYTPLSNLLFSGFMSTEVKLDAVILHDGKETEFGSFNGRTAPGDKVNVQGKWSGNNVARAAERRATGDRFSRGIQAALGDSAQVQVAMDERREHTSGRNSGPVLAGTAYCISSCSMILLNKIVLSSYAFNAGISLMFYQNLISTVLVVILSLCGAVSVEKLNWKLIKVWIPVNVIFVGMLVSGMYSLKYINIAMVTILKNVTNILTAIGELYMFRKRQNQKVWTAMFLMVIQIPVNVNEVPFTVPLLQDTAYIQIISAISGGITDLSFDTLGYAWQISNCILTASYSLTLRRVMDKAKLMTKSGCLNEVSMVLLNNLLSLPFAVFLILLFDEWDYVTNVDVIRIPMFWVVATASGLLGLAISFTSMWFLNQTGPTTYSLVGSLNKIPISVAGIVLFKVPVSVPNLFSILFGLFAGVFFARAKMS
ncbi:hypothetical protein RJ639_032848 [Escallonia herrerae]|uniref:Sugar phosphate transporter domain-containing protein n=1 Tax=Escallonia herrerae TaxID=1293975 RepID=A0AA88X1Y2_9ASTE|nr:hypothetical protein RJ639_032848 [Escallonia herrerae]